MNGRRPPGPFAALRGPLEKGRESLRKGFTIYAKALITFAVLVLLLFGVLFTLTESVIISQFLGIERGMFARELDRMSGQIDRPLARLRATLLDWSNRDEMDAHARRPDISFAKRNLKPADLSNSGVDFIWLDRPDRELEVLAGGGSGDASEMLAGIEWKPPSGDDPSAGFYLPGGRLAMLAAAPVRDSSGKSEPSGVLIFGKWMTEAMLREFTPSGATDVRVFSLADALANPVLQPEVIRLLAKQEPVIFEAGEETLAGLVLLRDAEGRASAGIEVRVPRDLYFAGVRSTRIFLLAMTAAGGFLILILWVVIDLNLLRRIGRMDSAVQSLRETGSLPGELTLAEEDELGRLAGSIRDLTRSLQDAEGRYRMLFETSKDGTLVLDPDGMRIRGFNRAFCELFGKSREEVEGRLLGEVLPSFPIGELRSAAASTRSFWYPEFQPGGAGVAVVEVIGVFFENSSARYLQLNFRDISERKKNETVLRELSGRLLRLQDEERRKIARELHDSTAQNLSALEMNFSLLEKMAHRAGGEFEKLVRSGREIAGQCSREIRTLSYLLHPPLLDEVGLLFAIRWFAEGYAARTGIKVALDLPEGFPRLDKDLETALFRVMQESLTNIYKHSGSSDARVRLALETSLVVLEVADSGRGLNGSGTSVPGLGLPGMRERIRQQGGKFILKSGKSGTLVRVEIPFSESFAQTELPFDAVSES